MAIPATGSSEIVGFDAAEYTASDIKISPDDAQAGLELDADGTIDKIDIDGPVSNIGTWYTSVLDADNYEVRLDYLSGAVINGGNNTGQWYLGETDAPNGWWITETGIGENTFIGTFRIRPAGGGADIDTASVTITAASEP